MLDSAKETKVLKPMVKRRNLGEGGLKLARKSEYKEQMSIPGVLQRKGTYFQDLEPDDEEEKQAEDQNISLTEKVRGLLNQTRQEIIESEISLGEESEESEEEESATQPSSIQKKQTLLLSRGRP